MHSYNSIYSFASDYSSAFYRIINSDLCFLIIDSIEEDTNPSKFVSELRQIDKLDDLVVIVITKEHGCEQGLSALQAGADDYVALPLVERELAVRVQAHLNKNNKNNKNNTYAFYGIGIDLDTLYPLEDRVLIKQSLTYISNHISSLHKVEDLAVSVGRSERYLNAVFHEHLGQSVFEYIRNFRMEKAKELLITTRVLIVDIAEELGYSSAENFSTAFKSQVKMSPSAYRSLARKS